MHGKRDLVRTYKLRGYEIPAANPRVFLHLAGILLVPLAWIGAVWWWSPESPHRIRMIWTALGWTALWLAFFHVRNIAVRKEVEQGLHDPVYGPHLLRMRQRDFDLSKTRKTLIVLYVGAFMAVAVVVGLRWFGVDLLPALPKSAAGRISLERASH